MTGLKINPLVLVMALAVVGEIILTLCRQPVPPIIEHVLLVLLGVLVPQEQLQPTQTHTVVQSESITPPPAPVADDAKDGSV